MKISITKMIPGAYLSPKGRYQPVKFKSGKPRYHPAWDLLCPEDTPIYAPGSGVVTHVDDYNNSEAGKWLEITFPKMDIVLKFMHLSKIIVRDDEKFEPFDLLAKSGNTGHSTAPHVHLQVYHYGVLVDPSLIFKLE